MPFPPSACDVCGKPFVPTRHRQKGCSPACQKAGRLRRRLAVTRKGPHPPVACRVCGASFAPDRKNGVVCGSADCRVLAKRRSAKARRHDPKPTGAESRTCVVCGSAFVGHHNALTCSRPCFLARHREVTRRRLGVGTYRCVACGAEIADLGADGKDRYTCSDGCRDRARRNRQSRAYRNHAGVRKAKSLAIRRARRAAEGLAGLAELESELGGLAVSRSDLSHRPFGRLVAVWPTRLPSGRRGWFCWCDPETGGCGRTAEVLTERLTGGRTKSCGCLQRDHRAAVHATPRPVTTRPDATWSAEELALLGTGTDAEVASEIGRSEAAVTHMRLRKGVRRNRPWTEADDALLGTDSDRRIAVRLGRTQTRVTQRRIAEGVPAYTRPLPPGRFACPRCGAAFERAAGSNRVYCGQPCASLASARRKRARDRAADLGTLTDKLRDIEGPS